MLNSIFDLATTNSISISNLLIATLASIVLGFGVALTYMYKNVYSKSFVVTLVLLPAIVQVVIMMVNGNLGTGVAVMGAFSLVRFRSIPGTAKDISSIFFAMAVGLATGMGYITIAFLFLIIISLVSILLSTIKFGEQKIDYGEKELKITIPENLDYNGVFDDLLKKYTKKSELIHVKTTNLGSLYELKYLITMKNSGEIKDFMDALRCRNGNLNIACGRVPSRREEL